MPKDKKTSSGRLKDRLDSYTASAGAIGATLRQRLGNWPIYAAATGSALAMATSASADSIIVYTGSPVTLSAPRNSFRTQRVPLPNTLLGTTLSFQLLIQHFTGNPGSGEAVGGAAEGRVIVASDFAKNLAFGAAISGLASFSGSEGLLKYKGTPRNQAPRSLGNWVASVPGFEGFSFSGNFGWAELEVGVDGNGYPDSVTLLGMAYNNTGAPITAGEGSPIPEPGTAGLMLLALGAAGVTLLRKRKQVASTPGQASVSDEAQ